MNRPRCLHRHGVGAALARVRHARGEVLNDAEVRKFQHLHEEILRLVRHKEMPRMAANYWFPRQTNGSLDTASPRIACRHPFTSFGTK